MKREDRDEFFSLSNNFDVISLRFPKIKEIHKKMAEKVKTITTMSDYKYKETSNNIGSGHLKIKTNGSTDEIMMIVETLLVQAFSVDEKTKLEFWCSDVSLVLVV